LRSIAQATDSSSGRGTTLANWAGMTRWRLAAPLMLTAALAAACDRPVEPPRPNPALELILAKHTPPERDVRDAVWKDARAFYAQRGLALAWVDGPFPARRAEQAFAVLQSAEQHGLRANAYGIDELRRESFALQVEDIQTIDVARRLERLARFDVRLTTRLLTLGRDVALGRAERTASERATRKPPDFAGTLAKAVSDGALHLWLNYVRPDHREYAALQQALAGLLAREQSGGWPVVAESVSDVERDSDLLRSRLAATGDLPSSPADDDVAEGVRSFQNHHGLKASGRLDAATLAALNVPLADRIRQIEINLERWRSMPDDLGARHILVNIPEFHLLARENGQTVLDMRVVVGKRGDETPSLSSRMTHVVLSPYWNIPESIVADETLPAVERDPAYLTRHNIEIVRTAGSRPEIVDPTSVDWADTQSLKRLLFRQRPGSANALGLVKFMFPNAYDVYIHDTPADRLFNRVGRTFSHGCVRIEDPIGLARYVLRDQPRWTEPALYAAMHGGAEQHVRLTTAIPVHIAYFTAWVDEQGGLHFRNDVYGYDRSERTRLAARSNTAVVGTSGRIS
jgi:murein L,D-transpeptidase YcbB/YkuD